LNTERDGASPDATPAQSAKSREEERTPELKYAAPSLSQSVVFVMTDDKIYHYTWQRSDNKTTQRDQDGEEAPENFDLKVFD
jgi:hypothetical protein|tara:strand:- start:1005 stop:1250 length:246 start_codon:yes stop_codon:yes gene_type:complete